MTLFSNDLVVTAFGMGAAFSSEVNKNLQCCLQAGKTCLRSPLSPDGPTLEPGHLVFPHRRHS